MTESKFVAPPLPPYNCGDRHCVVCTPNGALTMDRVVTASIPYDLRPRFPSLSLMKLRDPVFNGGAACYCDGSCNKGERCAAFPNGKADQYGKTPADHAVSVVRLVQKELADIRIGSVAYEQPPEAPKPRLRRLGGTWVCYSPNWHDRGYGGTPTRAWNAWVSRLDSINKLHTP